MKTLKSLTVPGCPLILAPGQPKTVSRRNKRQIRGEWRSSLFKERVSGATILLKEAGSPCHVGISPKKTLQQPEGGLGLLSGI
jgi:hypothetical protein